eukprot:326675-Chlamydomonas_euryale.AAC.5
MPPFTPRRAPPRWNFSTQTPSNRLCSADAPTLACVLGRERSARSGNLKSTSRLWPCHGAAAVEPDAHSRTKSQRQQQQQRRRRQRRAPRGRADNALLTPGRRDAFAGARDGAAAVAQPRKQLAPSLPQGRPALCRGTSGSN